MSAAVDLRNFRVRENGTSPAGGRLQHPKPQRPNIANRLTSARSRLNITLRHCKIPPSNMTNNWHGLGVDGWKFVATLQLRTPLSVLSRHGEKRSTHVSLEPVNMADGIWVPTTKGWEHAGIPSFEPIEMASEIGPVSIDGGDFLKFLMAVRGVVERQTTVEARMTDLKEELANVQWQEFVSLYGGPAAIMTRFFPAFVDTIPGLSASAAVLLTHQGLTTPQRITAMSDAELLTIKGIGPAKLAAIRTACTEASDHKAEFVERVRRHSIP